MKLKSATILTAILAALSANTYATNGDNLIGIGPISRSLGGVGIAAPQDSITSITANPASLGFGLSSYSVATPSAPEISGGKSAKDVKHASPIQHASGYNSSIDVFSTFFIPNVSAQANGVSADSDEKTYVIPGFAWSTLLGGPEGRVGIGLAAYGAAGLGVDYRDTALDNRKGYNFSGTSRGPFAPLVAGEYTQYQQLKIVPAVGVRLSDQFALGISGHFNHNSLDLRNDGVTDWSFGGQVGLTFRPTDNISFGITYISEQEAEFDRVTDFDADGRLDGLKLAQPQQVSFGVATELANKRLLIETNVKWVNWESATGYEDFGWKNSWLAGVGIQYQAIPNKLYLRAGYHFGSNPVEEESGWNGGYSPRNTKNVQGKNVPNYYYQSFRDIGFPALVEHHITAGVGYAFTESVSLNVGYTHAFENSITSRGSNLYGQSTSLKSSLSEDSVEVGLSIKF